MDYTTLNNISKAVSAFEMIANSMARPSVPSPAVDLTPIADAIREGFTAMATAIEYVAQLEDNRVRDLNKQIEEQSKTAKKSYKSSSSGY